MTRYVIPFFLLTSTAIAQPAPAPLPIEITPDELKQLDEYLGSQPFKFSAPLVNFFNQKQKTAQETAKSKVKPE